MKKTINDVTMEINEKGIITWMNKWEKVYELVTQGYLSMTFYPALWGHCEFTLRIP